MDNAVLVGNSVDGGRRLIQALDSAGFNVSSALWLYTSEEHRWKLIIASPDVAHKGPRTAYKSVSRLLRERSDIDVSFDDIMLIDHRDKLITLLRSALGLFPGMHEVRFTNNYIHGTPIDDAIIYRLR
jgi:hypothetical protein